MKVVEVTYNWAHALTRRSRTTLLVLHHEAGSGSTPQQIHAYHLSKGWSGIAYHYYIRKNGTIYRGRSENMIGGHCLGYNSVSIGICFEGNFEIETMGPEQINAGWELIEDILRRYPGISVRRHKDLNQTSCPGTNFPFGILTGKMDPSKEDVDMTKEEVLTIIEEHDAEKTTATAASPGYAEEQVAMAKAKDKGFMDGTRPDCPLTRGEYAITLQRRGELN